MTKKYPEGMTCTAPCNPPCQRKAVVHGLCQAHYQRKKAGHTLDSPILPWGGARRRKRLVPVSNNGGGSNG